MVVRRCNAFWGFRTMDMLWNRNENITRTEGVF